MILFTGEIKNASFLLFLTKILQFFNTIGLLIFWYKCFRISFMSLILRSILEFEISVEEKLFMINDKLSTKSEAYKDIYKKLVLEKRFPDSFFINILCELNGVTKNTASILWESGYLTKEQVLNAPYSELIEIKGLGKSLISKIKN